MSISVVTELKTYGYAVTEVFLTAGEINNLIESLVLADESPHAQRNLLRTNQVVQSLAKHPFCCSLAKQVLGSSARAVKATFFDKTSAANWKVPPHQDVTIAVQERIDTDGFYPWTIKSGINNVQPPPDVLENMVAFRVHLDDCAIDNGALKVWSGSHSFGRLRDAGIEKWIADHDSVLCPVPAGALMIMRPLLIHASSPASNPTHRRVIHIEYAACDLPNGLKWLDEVPIY